MAEQHTVRDLIPQYIEVRRKEYEAGLEKSKRQARTRRQKTLVYGSFKEIERLLVRDFLPYFGDLHPKQITARRFEKFCEDHTGDMANHRKVLNGFLSWCEREEIIEVRPRFTIPKWDRRIRHVLSKEEIIKLMSKAAEDMVNFTFVTLGLMHGLRPHERTQLRKDDFNFELMCINIRWDTVKTRKPRLVPLNSECAPIFQKYFSSYDSPYVFPHRDDPSRHATRGWYQSRWKKLLRCSGLFDRHTGKLKDITPHDLRATAEKFAAMKPEATPVMREKQFGAKPAVQDDKYITRFEVDELRFMSNAVTDEKIGVADLKEIFNKVSNET